MRHAAMLSLLGALLLASPGYASAEEPGTARLDALVTIRFDPASRAVLWPEVEALLEGSPRQAWGEPVSELLSRPLADIRTVELTREDVLEEGVLCVRVGLVTVPGLRADRFFDALVGRLEHHLRDGHQREVQARQQQALELRARAAVLTKRIDAVREEGALPWPLSASAFYETLLERRHDVRARLADLAVEEQGLVARRAALQEQYARIHEKVAQETQALDREWAVVVRAREQAVAYVHKLVEAGKADPMDAASTEEALARARIERAELRVEEGARPAAALAWEIKTAVAGLDVDRAALVATREHLTALEATLKGKLEARQGDLLTASYGEEELRLVRDRALELQHQLASTQPPAASVLRLD